MRTLRYNLSGRTLRGLISRFRITMRISEHIQRDHEILHETIGILFIRERIEAVEIRLILRT